MPSDPKAKQFLALNCIQGKFKLSDRFPMFQYLPLVDLHITILKGISYQPLVGLKKIETKAKKTKRKLK